LSARDHRAINSAAAISHPPSPSEIQMKLPRRFHSVVSHQDMKKALENPSLGIKVIDVREPDGFKYLKSVKGGITAWSEEIDSKVPRY
jgi:rhodanese-related sulfurtransferase